MIHLSHAIELWPVEKLIPYSNNSRTHSEEQVSQIAASIKEFGFTNPILVDSKQGIIAGHGRLMAAKKLGLAQVPVIKLDHLTDAQRRAYVIADNKLALNAGWDIAVLSAEIDRLSEEGFELPLLGFSDEELEDLMVEPEEQAPQGDAEAVPEALAQEKVVRGEVYILGKHRLMCGDSTSPTDVEKLMGGKTAELVFTDPPYRMAVEGGSNQLVGQAARKLGEAIKHLCEFDPDAFLNTLPTVFEKGVMNTYIFCNKDLVPDYLKWGVEAGYSFNILFWKKPAAIPLGGSHRPDVEYLLLFRRGATWNNGIEGVNYSKCLEYGRVRDKEQTGGHPTPKPIELIENEIQISSTKKGIVVDFFGGSGSTMIACEKHGRAAHLMELDPKYCQVILDRWEKFSGKKAQREDGTPWSEIRGS